jgi:ribosome-associated heat shock protein Hsp15
MAEDNRQRLDKWLFYARLAKSRAVATRLIEEGHVRVNRIKAEKPAATLKPGDVLTLSLGSRILVLRVLAPGTRRGPATQARELYEPVTE